MPFLISSSRFFARRCARHHFLPFDEAREYARSLGLTRWKQWVAFSKSSDLPAGIPVTPDKIYRDSGWAGSQDWLGYDSKTKPRVMTDGALRRKQIFARAIKERQRITDLIQQQDSRIEFKHLGLGLEANLLFRITQMSKPDTNFKPDLADPTINSDATSNLILNSNSVSRAQDVYLPIQMKSGVRLFKDAQNMQVYGAQNLTCNRDVGIIVMSGDSNSGDRFLSLPYDRPQNSRSKSYRIEQCFPLSDLPALLYHWWNIRQPTSEQDWRNRLCGNSNKKNVKRVLVERLSTLVQSIFFDPCGLTLRQIPDVDDAANLLLNDKIKIRSIIAARQKNASRNIYIHRTRSFRPGYLNELLSQKDAIDFYLIIVHTDGLLNGFFMIPQTIFLEKMVGSSVGERNNLGTCMLYPPFVTPRSKKGKIMQVWQNEYYVSNVEEFRALTEKFGLISSEKLELKSTLQIDV